MNRATLDTGILASGFIRAQSLPGKLLGRWRPGAFELVISEYILSELTQTFAEPYFRQRFT